MKKVIIYSASSKKMFFWLLYNNMPVLKECHRRFTKQTDDYLKWKKSFEKKELKKSEIACEKVLYGKQ